MSSRKYCSELIEVVDVMDQGLRAPLIDITQDQLNEAFADHKMTIGHTNNWKKAIVQLHDEDRIAFF